MDRVRTATPFPNEQNMINVVDGGRKEETGIKTQCAKV
jgi:hypothetical protein